MKKVLSIVAIAALTAGFVACGPSKEELEKREKERTDSIAAVDKARQDSIAQAEADAAKAAAEAEAKAKAAADSTRIADSLAKVKPGKKGH